MPRAAPYTELAVRSRGLKQAPVACKLTHALKLLLPQNGEKCSRDERVQKYKRLRAEIAAAIKIYRFNCAIEGQETLGSIDQALRLMRRKVARRQRAKKELMEEMAKPYTKRDLPRAYREWSRHARAGPAALLEWEVEQFGEAAVREFGLQRPRLHRLPHPEPPRPLPPPEDRPARACRRRLDYYPCPEAMEIIEAHRGPGVGFNEIIDALILKAARLPD
mgnify:CR=1 FL=1